MQIHGSPIPHNVDSAPSLLRSHRAPAQSNAGRPRPELEGRGYFTRLTENVFENKTGTARVEVHDDGSITLSSDFYGEFRGKIEDGTLVAENQHGHSFTAKVKGDPDSGHFIVYDLEPSGAGARRSAATELFGEKRADGQAKVLDTIA